ncbi:hypothetical protein CPB84DRAFT_1206902 [Gymnopilus junonius]|uniref:Nephrocystin 3-like N-terminal domain-containing protein n=1 Tax=Gymnopilus junonius TaxID=109634 RepID=A0A9P5NIS4_GYMJU|nr:hypothetical protein CPB84DRAFT_1206902 [Gymnopilus junonius]
MFDHSSNLPITGGTFTAVEGDLHVHNFEPNHKKALEVLHNQIAAGAFHNSAERFDPPKCHPHTRKAVLGEIIDWAENNDKLHPFLWMYGPAGSGKSSIAQTIAEQLHQEGKLAASFFFARTATGRNTADRLMATIAYQLTLSIPTMSHHILEAVDRDPAIFSKSLDTQLESLILGPLKELFMGLTETTGSSNMPRLIIIDGLDECRKADFQRLILSVFFAALRKSSIPFVFLIASRPEPEIRRFFNQDSADSLSHRLVLDDKYKPNKDIEVFLWSRFDDIRNDHPLQSLLPATWPSDSDIERLVIKASGQFIYAATVMKFVESPQHRPIDRLDIIFGLSSPGSNTPFAELDALYLYIFSSAEDTIRVVETFSFLILRNSSSYVSMNLVEDFFCFRRGDLQIILNDLHSIIYVPKPSQSSNPLHLFHASLSDFLQDKTRSGRFFIDSPENHEKMARLCIRHIQPHTLKTGP